MSKTINMLTSAQGADKTGSNFAHALGASLSDASVVHSIKNNRALGKAMVSTESLTDMDRNTAMDGFRNAQEVVRASLASAGISDKSVKDFNILAGASLLAASAVENLAGLTHAKNQSIQASLESAGLSQPANARYTPSEDVFQIATESFDEKELSKFLNFSIALNVLASRQDPVNELFFRPLTVAPNECGYAIESRIEEVYQGYQHEPSGSPVNTYKVNLIDALVHPEVLESNATAIVPYVSATNDENSPLYNKDHYVDNALVAHKTVDVDGIPVLTAPLKVNMEHNLLGLTSHPELISNGLLNEKDSLDSKASIKAVYVKFDDKVVKFNTANLHRTGFLKTPEGNMNEMALNFTNKDISVDKDIKAVDGSDVPLLADMNKAELRVRLNLRMTGTLFRDTGTLQVDATRLTVGSAVKGKEPVSLKDAAVKTIVEKINEKIEVIGFDIDVNRSNSSLRTRGRLIDSTLIREIVAVQLRAPISIERPVVGGEKPEPQVEALISAVRIQANNAGISTLFAYADSLNTVVSRDGYDQRQDRNSIPGIARHYLQPVYIRETINLKDIVNSPASESKMKDIQGAISTKLNEVMGRMIQQSNYIAVVEQYGGDVNKVKAILATDYRIPQYLNIQGDVRLFGSTLGHAIASTPNKHMRGKIVMSISREASGNEVDPFEFGNFIWSSELMVQRPMDRGQQTFLRDMVQPRYAHSVNVPIIAIIDVEGIEEVAGSAVEMPVYLTRPELAAGAQAGAVAQPAAVGGQNGKNPKNPQS